MNKIALGIVCILLTTASIAQGRHAKIESSVRIKGGLNFANISLSDGTVDKNSTLNSFHVGFLWDLPISQYVAFEAGLQYTGKGVKLEYGDPASDFYVKSKSGPMYIEVPVQFIARLPLKIVKPFLGAGGYGALGVAGKNEVESTTILGTSYSNKNILFSGDEGTSSPYGFARLKRFDYGLNFTGGIELTKILLSANYSMGLANIVEGSSNSGNQYKHRVFSVSVGLIL